jgi:hypothetical protein
MADQAGTPPENESEHATEASTSRLPVWPIAVLLLGTPIWWLTGTSLFMWPLLTGVMVIYLLVRGSIRFPVGFAIWLAFLAWMAVSGLMLIGGSEDGGLGKYAGNALLYGTATVLFLYAYRVSKDPGDRRQLVFVAAGFWGIIVLGGWFGTAFPDFSLTTPVERLAPGLTDENEFIASRITADAATDTWLGSRPRAPFGAINEWGSNFALTLPFALAAIVLTRSRWIRLGIAALVATSIVPVVESQNRGMWLALGLVGVYALLRFGSPLVRRLSTPKLAIAGAVAALCLVAVALSPMGDTVVDRISSEDGSGSGRTDSHRDALRLAADSPVLGYGSTQETETSPLPVGTHGHGFRLLVSHGVIGLLLFVSWFAVVAWRTRRGPPAVLAAHLCVLIGFCAMAFYNLLPAQLHVMMLAAAIGLAAATAAASRPGDDREPGLASD